MIGKPQVVVCRYDCLPWWARRGNRAERALKKLEEDSALPVKLGTAGLAAEVASSIGRKLLWGGPVSVSEADQERTLSEQALQEG